MSEIERLAKTLATVTFDPETTVTLNGRTTFFEGSAEDAVRAVLTAMREPRGDLVSEVAANCANWGDGLMNGREVWSALIDHILNEQPK